MKSYQNNKSVLLSFMETKTSNLLIIGFCILTVIIIFIPAAPNMSIPHTDSGVFLYGGMNVLSGKIPYRDFWDHKGPIIFYINAIGESLTNGTQWGVWILEIVFLIGTCFLFLSSLLRNLGYLATFSGIIFLLLSFNHYFSGGNYTEEFNIPLQCLALLIISQKKHRNIFSLLIGNLCAISFLLRANNIVFFLMAIISLTITRKTIKDRFYLIILFFIGFLMIAIPFLFYFYFTDSLSSFFEQAFLYNYVYVGKSSFFKNIFPSLKSFVEDNFVLLIIPIIAWLDIFLKNIATFKKTKIVNPLELTAVLDFPFEILIITLSGRNFLHYNLLLIISSSILITHFIFGILKRIHINKRGFRVIGIFLSCILLITLLIPQLPEVRTFVGRISRNGFDSFHLEIENYIEENTNSDQTVLVWGTQTTLNFLSNRFSPTRYSYQTPLINQYYSSPELIEEFLNDLKQNLPELIIDTRNPFPISGLRLAEWELNNSDSRILYFTELFKFIEQNYYFETTISNDYDILKLKE